jgi:hypothetical protein
LEKGSRNAKLLKVADRISNLTDLHTDIFSDRKMRDYLDQTEKYILPMAKSVNADMVIELDDLIKKRRASLNMATLLIHNLKRADFVRKTRTLLSGTLPGSSQKKQT